MKKIVPSRSKREDSLSRDKIVEASIALLDQHGDAGLTFRALAAELQTGPGALYWHMEGKADLVIAACDALMTQILASALATPQDTPEAELHAIAAGIYDAIDQRPWLASALTQSTGGMPVIRLFEAIGQRVSALGLPDGRQWQAASTLLHYILGVSAQNAAISVFAKQLKLDRQTSLEEAASVWAALDPRDFPFSAAIAGRLATHDDRQDFVDGVDLILAGLRATGGTAR